MKKQIIFYLVAGVAALILVAGGWYAYKFRDCMQKVSYVPQGTIGGNYIAPKDISNESGFIPGSIAAKYTPNQSDYYRFDFQAFKTSEDAMRACIWK